MGRGIKITVSFSQCKWSPSTDLKDQSSIDGQSRQFLFVFFVVVVVGTTAQHRLSKDFISLTEAVP